MPIVRYIEVKGQKIIVGFGVGQRDPIGTRKAAAERCRAEYDEVIRCKEEVDLEPTRGKMMALIEAQIRHDQKLSREMRENPVFFAHEKEVDIGTYKQLRALTNRHETVTLEGEVLSGESENGA